MLRMKPGVKAAALRPELLLGIMVVQEAYRKVAPTVDCVITSISDGVHSTTSLHYAGQAADFRTRTLTDQQIDIIAAEVEASLTEDYDFIVESDHYHLEYQPRRR